MQSMPGVVIYSFLFAIFLRTDGGGCLLVPSLNDFRDYLPVRAENLQKGIAWLIRSRLPSFPIHLLRTFTFFDCLLDNDSIDQLTCLFTWVIQCRLLGFFAWVFPGLFHADSLFYPDYPQFSAPNSLVEDNFIVVTNCLLVTNYFSPITLVSPISTHSLVEPGSDSTSPIRVVPC